MQTVFPLIQSLRIGTSVFTSVRRRSSTFITYRITDEGKGESSFTDEEIPTEPCSDCFERENQLERTKEENRQLRSINAGYRRSKEENGRLKEHLKRIHEQLMNYRMSFDLLKEEMLIEKYNRSKQTFEAEQIQRLRHELVIYNQITIAKRREEEKHISFTDLIQRKNKFY